MKADEKHEGRIKGDLRKTKMIYAFTASNSASPKGGWNHFFALQTVI